MHFSQAGMISSASWAKLTKCPEIGLFSQFDQKYGSDYQVAHPLSMTAQRNMKVSRNRGT